MAHWLRGRCDVRFRRILIGLLGGLALLPTPAQAVSVKYLYRLSNFSGIVPYSDVQIYADRAHDEVYVGEGDSVRVFNASGMEIYEFAHDAMHLGTVADLAVDKKGDILVLSYRPGSATRRGGMQVTRYSYRGEPLGFFELSGLPPEIANFSPDRMILHGDEIAFASIMQCRVVFTDLSGVYRRHVDLVEALSKDDKARADAELGGFFIDGKGAILYTIPTAFRAFRRNPDGTFQSWGKPGSAPGTFGVVGSIVEDDQGDVFVADRARGVVLVFDSNFHYVMEFGGRGRRQARLVRPGALAVGNDGKLYVTQLANRGVSVFAVDSP